MMRTTLLRFAPLCLAVALAGCAASDGSPGDDAITPQEVAEGEAWAAANGDEHDDDETSASSEQPGVEVDDDVSVATPAEDSTPFLTPEELREPPEEPMPPGQVDVDGLSQTQSCHKATGYRRGKAFTICITKVDGKWVEVNTARAYLRMRKAARARGVSLRVNSGFRTMAQQRYLYNCYKTKRCNNGNLAAPPGYSNHQSGKALDLNTSARGVYSFLTNNAKKYGFRRTVPSERWHWER